MSEELQKALFTAQEAKSLAEAANKRIDDLGGHLTTIAASVESMRRENTDQHTHNARRMDEGFGTLNQRISSVKQTQDEDRRSNIVQISDLEKTIITRTSELKEKIVSVGTEAREGDKNIVADNHKRWLHIALQTLKYTAIIVGSMVLYHFGFNVQIPG